MKPIFKNILAVIVGWVVGSIANISLVELGHYLLPLKGVDTQNLEELSAALATVDYKYFFFPFLAHALGTLIGAVVAGTIATRKMTVAFIIGGIFFLGGVLVVFMIPTTTWFTILDLTFGYFPMAWIGGSIARGFSK